MGSKIEIKRLERRSVVIPIVGVTPLILHRFSEKAKQQMRDKQSGKARGKLPPKRPEEDAADATYWLPDGRPGIPAVAFKAAIGDAARYYDKSVTMEDLKRSIFVVGEVGSDGMPLVAVEGDMTMREDLPRIGKGVPDLRYRNAFWPWGVSLEVKFLVAMISEEALVNIVDAAGNGGVGDWRQSSKFSKSGTFGQFAVAVAE